MAPFIMLWGAGQVLSWGGLKAAWIVHSVQGSLFWAFCSSYFWIFRLVVVNITGGGAPKMRVTATGMTMSRIFWPSVGRTQGSGSGELARIAPALHPKNSNSQRHIRDPMGDSARRALVAPAQVGARHLPRGPGLRSPMGIEAPSLSATVQLGIGFPLAAHFKVCSEPSCHVSVSQGVPLVWSGPSEETQQDCGRFGRGEGGPWRAGALRVLVFWGLELRGVCDLTHTGHGAPGSGFCGPPAQLSSGQQSRRSCSVVVGTDVQLQLGLVGGSAETPFSLTTAPSRVTHSTVTVVHSLRPQELRVRVGSGKPGG